MSGSGDDAIVGYAQALKDGSLQPRTLQGLGTLVLDEADLLLSFGYEDDLRQLQPLVSVGHVMS